MIRSVVVALLLTGCGSGTTQAPALGNTGAPADKTVPQREPPMSAELRTWIAALEDPRQAERAVSELEQLGDPRAIGPLGTHWERTGRNVYVLRVIISLARPLTAEQARATYVTDFETTGRPASWDRAEPFLRAAIAGIDVANPRSVDNATRAAQAAGEAPLPSLRPELIELASQPTNKKSIAAQISAVRALGILGGPDSKRALLKLIEREPPPHPASVPRAAAREAEEAYGMHLALDGSAINAIGVLASTAEAEVLIREIYVQPELSMQLRRAMAANGPLVVDTLRSVLRGEHAGINDLFAERKLGVHCEGDGAKRQCTKLSAMPFYAALVLGDLHDQKAVPDLLAALKVPPAPVYVLDGQAGPNTQHNAVFDALRRIGAPEAAKPLREIWTRKTTDLATRDLAIGSYAFVARDAAGVDELGKIAADMKGDDMVRTAAALSYARLATDKKHIKPLLDLAQKYLDASAKHGKDAGTKYKTDAKRAKQALRDSKAYLGFARMFQTHVARIEVALRCKEDVACYAATLAELPHQAALHVEPYLPDVKTWTHDEQLGLHEASVERAMLELGKLGAKAEPVTETLLDAMKSDNRMIRESILLALPKLARLPCRSCVTKLDAALVVAEKNASLGAMSIEIAIARNYFTWAK